MSLPRFVHYRIVLPVGAVSAGLALVAQGGRFNAHLDILTHFAPIYLAGGTLVLVAALFIHQRLAPALLGAAAVTLSLILMAPEFLHPKSAPAPVGAPGQIKLIQFNAAQDSHGLEERLAWLAREDPDVLVVEDSRPVFQTAIAKGMGRHMSCGMTCEVAIFTRAAPVRIESPRRGRYGMGPAIAIVHLAGAGGEYTVIGTHYDWPTNVEYQYYNGLRLLELLKRQDTTRTILAGDFNSTPWSFVRRREEAKYGMERRTRALPTWPADGRFGLAFLPIDHVYAGSGWRTVSITRGPPIGSDHYPLVAIFAPRTH
ncbi:MAG TPA: endonuclease/exonuclease/phosphatase family protein [Phenylobacterium sp.]|nr:endonuclease/exonuclease/phosphatase family protein [Phenylobacterium sp.]